MVNFKSTAAFSINTIKTMKMFNGRQNVQRRSKQSRKMRQSIRIVLQSDGGKELVSFLTNIVIWVNIQNKLSSLAKKCVTYFTLQYYSITKISKSQPENLYRALIRAKHKTKCNFFISNAKRILDEKNSHFPVTYFTHRVKS